MSYRVEYPHVERDCTEQNQALLLSASCVSLSGKRKYKKKMFLDVGKSQFVAQTLGN